MPVDRDPNELITRQHAINPRKVGKFEGEMHGNTTPPPVQVFKDFDGKEYVLNGTHRTEAARRAGRNTIPVEYLREDDEMGGTNVLTMILRMILRVK